MTIKQKREIVRRFKRGGKIITICEVMRLGDCGYAPSSTRKVEQVLRDYMNGRFELDSAKGKS